jgi:hypothetical protein
MSFNLTRINKIFKRALCQNLSVNFFSVHLGFYLRHFIFQTLIVCILLTVSSRQPVSLTLSSSTVILITLLVSFSHVTFCTSQSLYSTYLCGRSYTSVAMQLVSFGSILFSLITLSSSNFIQTNIKVKKINNTHIWKLRFLFLQVILNLCKKNKEK